MKSLLPLLLAGLTLAGVVRGQVPGLMNYQGQVTDALGVNLPTGTYTMHFRIFDVATGGVAVWGPQSFDGTAGTGKGAQVPVVDGFFNVILGAQDTTSRNLADAFGAANRYLEIQVGANPAIAPRQQILSAPYALKANQVVDGSIVTASLANGAVTGAKIGGTTIAAGNLADGAVTSAKILDGSIIAADVSSAHAILNKSGSIYTLLNLGSGPNLDIRMGDLNGVANNSAVTLELPGNNTLGIWDALNVHSSLTVGSTLNVSGPVGIGTPSPNAKLHVNGDGTQPALRVQVSGQSKLTVAANGGVSIGLLNDTPNPNGLQVQGLLGATSGISLGGNTSITGIDLLVGFDDLRLRPTGSYPRDAFYIASGGQMAMNGAGSSPGVGSNVLLNIGTAGSSAVEFSINLSGQAGKPGGGPFADTSDVRLKKNIEPLSGILEKLLRLRSVSYQFNNLDGGRHGDKTYLGFIAQEVEGVFPEWVGEGPKGIKVLGIQGFESLAVQALRELRSEKDDQIKSLTDKVAAQDKELAELKSTLNARLAALEKAAEHPVSVAQ